MRPRSCGFLAFGWYVITSPLSLQGEPSGRDLQGEPLSPSFYSVIASSSVTIRVKLREAISITVFGDCHGRPDYIGTPSQ